MRNDQKKDVKRPSSKPGNGKSNKPFKSNSAKPADKPVKSYGAKPADKPAKSYGTKPAKKPFASGTAKGKPKAASNMKFTDNYYKCYSVKLNEFLKSHDLQTVSEVRHAKTNKIAFIYEKTKKLDELLTFWTKNKDKNAKL